MFIVNYDSACSTVTPIGAIFGLSVSTSNKCAYDSRNQILYFYASNLTTNVKAIYGVDATTAKVVSVTPTSAYQHVHMVFDPNSGKLVLATTDSTQAWSQYYVTIGSGATQLLNTLSSDYSSFLGEGSDLDTINGIQWFPSFDTVTVSSVQVGFRLSGGTILVTDPYDGGSPSFTQQKDGGMITFGYNDTTRTIVQWDPSSSTTQITMGAKSSWDIDYNGQIAYDATTTTLYSVFDNGSPYLDQFLVGVQSQTGYTASASYLAPGLVPWCLYIK